MATQNVLLRYSFSAVHVMAFRPEPGRCGSTLSRATRILQLQSFGEYFTFGRSWQRHSKQLAAGSWQQLASCQIDHDFEIAPFRCSAVAPAWHFAVEVGGPIHFDAGWWMHRSIPARPVSRSSNVFKNVTLFSVNILRILTTSSTAQGGGGSFKNRKPIRRGWLLWIKDGRAKPLMDWKVLDLSHSFSLFLCLSTYLPIYFLCIYPAIDLSIYLSLFHLSMCLAV